jgi:hypothetical protein
MHGTHNVKNNCHNTIKL